MDTLVLPFHDSFCICILLKLLWDEQGSNAAMTKACKGGHLEVAQWLYSVEPLVMTESVSRYHLYYAVQLLTISILE